MGTLMSSEPFQEVLDNVFSRRTQGRSGGFVLEREANAAKEAISDRDPCCAAAQSCREKLGEALTLGLFQLFDTFLRKGQW